jgi:hypothetical protein
LFPEDTARQKAVIEREEKLDYAARDYPLRSARKACFRRRTHEQHPQWGAQLRVVFARQFLLSGGFLNRFLYCFVLEDLNGRCITPGRSRTLSACTRSELCLGSPPAHTIVSIEMQLTNVEQRKVGIWEQLREGEGELFLLSEVSGERDFESRRRFQRLCGERTRLASKLLLDILR